MKQNIEIFIDKDYDEFNKDVCLNCSKWKTCIILDKLYCSRWNQGFDFPIDKIHRIDGDWICDDYEPILKDSFKINEDMMKQPVKGGWVKNIFKHK